SSEDQINAIIGDNVDIFDFEKYNHEYEFMKKYFSDLELVLRTALFIDYKYNHLDPKNNTVFEDKVKEKKTLKAQKEFIELTLDALEPLYVLAQWYRHFYPDKLEKFEKTYETYKH